jgi:aryl-alcohol dehydrogenase-like predicted oxidoreductase
MTIKSRPKRSGRILAGLCSDYRQNLTAFIERSLKNLETDSLDLLQLHGPPTR